MAFLSPQTIALKDNSHVILRSPETSDVSAFVDFQQQAAKETKFTLQVEGRIPPAEKYIAFWTKSKEDPQGLVVSAWLGDRVVGALGLHPEEPPHPWLAHVTHFGMSVLKSHWGTGLADVLVETMFTHAKSCGIKRIEATVRKANARGIAFYERHGFNIEGTRKMAAFIDGNYEDELFIAKLLLD